MTGDPRSGGITSGSLSVLLFIFAGALIAIGSLLFASGLTSPPRAPTQCIVAPTYEILYEDSHKACFGPDPPPTRNHSAIAEFRGSISDIKGPVKITLYGGDGLGRVVELSSASILAPGRFRIAGPSVFSEYAVRVEASDRPPTLARVRGFPSSGTMDIGSLVVGTWRSLSLEGFPRFVSSESDVRMVAAPAIGLTTQLLTPASAQPAGTRLDLPRVRIGPNRLHTGGRLRWNVSLSPAAAGTLSLPKLQRRILSLDTQLQRLLVNRAVFVPSSRSFSTSPSLHASIARFTKSGAALEIYTPHDAGTLVLLGQPKPDVILCVGYELGASAGQATLTAPRTLTQHDLHIQPASERPSAAYVFLLLAGSERGESSQLFGGLPGQRLRSRVRYPGQTLTLLMAGSVKLRWLINNIADGLPLLTTKKPSALSLVIGSTN